MQQVKGKPGSRRTAVREAEALLNRLLRTPKTRAGLIAAVAGARISRNYIFGWLTEQCRTGKVVVLKSAAAPMYLLSGHVVIEQPTAGAFPTWMEPRHLPIAGARRVYISGVEISPQEEKACA